MLCIFNLVLSAFSSCKTKAKEKILKNCFGEKVGVFDEFIDLPYLLKCIVSRAFLYHSNGEFKTLSMIYDGALRENSYQLLVVNYFSKKLHLRCLTMFWIRICIENMAINREILYRFLVINTWRNRLIIHSYFASVKITLRVNCLNMEFSRLHIYTFSN